MRIRLVAVALVLAVIAAPVPADPAAAAGSTYDPPQHMVYRWPEQRPVLRVEDRTGDPNIAAALAAETVVWNQTGAVTLVFTEQPSFPGPCEWHSHTVSVCRDDLPPEILGVTRWSPVGLALVGAFILISATADPAWLPFAVCHELGHALGLGHSADMAGSCMEPGGTVFTPTAPDVADRAIVDATYR